MKKKSIKQERMILKSYAESFANTVHYYKILIAQQLNKRQKSVNKFFD